MSDSTPDPKAVRKIELDNMLKGDLRTEVDTLDQLVESLASAGKALQAQVMDLQSQLDNSVQVAGVPMVLHIGGSEVNGDEARLVRCAAKGLHADKWVVHIGNRMYTQASQPMIAARFRHLSPPLQSKVGLLLDEALAQLHSLTNGRYR